MEGALSQIFHIGGIYRVHRRSMDENLNCPGIHFVLWPSTPPALPPTALPTPTQPNRFYVYGVIAQLAMLAASIELDEALNSA